MSLYTEHSGKVIIPDDRFKYVMAITLNPRTGYKDGIIRCITSRIGDVMVKGFTDRSELYKVHGENLEHFKIGERLNIKNEKEILGKILEVGDDFIGQEDPDIWIDPDTGLMHVYFTIPIRPGDKNKKTRVHLGHAVGRDMDSLEMTEPVLMGPLLWAKEISIAPLNSKGFRYNLIESKDRQPGMSYSTTRVAIVKNMGGPWEFGEVAFHPKDHNMPWIAKDASPGPLFSPDFINIGAGKRLGVINGREIPEKINDKIMNKIFSVGLFVYDYENGKIEWVSPEPLIRDSEARTITFASQFVETAKGEGILYAHVDDSFVRAYTLKAEDLKSILPSKYIL